MILFGMILLLSFAAQAQITITYLQVPHTPGNQFQYYALPADSVLVNIGQTGGPQVWDFTAGDTSTTSSDLYLDPALSPPEYARANTVIQTDQLNLFGMGEPGNLYCWLGPPRFILGAASTSYQGTPLGMMFTPYINQYPLPLSYGRIWSNTVNIDQIYNVQGNQYRLVLTATLNSQVDAWGTAQVPLGTYDVLRTRMDVSYNMTLYIWVLFFWVPVSESSGSSVNYDWKTQNLGVVAGLTTQATGPGQVWATSMRRLMNTNVTDVLAQGPVISNQQPATSNQQLVTNYPNPFNASTTISYELLNASHVRLTVYDVIGRQVATLVDGVQEVGSHEVLWAPQNLAAGPYFVQLRAEGQVSQHMVMYVK
jgi:hypothetical protein